MFKGKVFKIVTLHKLIKICNNNKHCYNTDVKMHTIFYIENY